MAEQKRLIAAYNEERGMTEALWGYPIAVTEGDYRPERFFEMAKGLENCPEGGERCFRCYDLRLRETALRGAEGGFDYFATTLTISPLKTQAKSTKSDRLCRGNTELPGCHRIQEKGWV